MIGLLLAAAVVGTLLLSAVFALPTDRIRENVKASVPQLTAEGDHFSVFSGLRHTHQDNYSDAEYLNGALVGNDAKGFFTGLYGLEYENTEIPLSYDSPVTVLANVFEDGAELAYKAYGTRFWNGYEVFVKPLLSFLTYGQIRHLNFYLEMAVMAVLIMLMHKNGLAKYVIPVLISYLLWEPVTVAASMTFAGFFYVTYIPCIVLLAFPRFFREKHLYPLFFMAIGIAAVYFNMNYFQILSFIYPLLFFCLINGFPKSGKNSVLLFAAAFLCWFAGYAGMMVIKWLVYEVATGETILPAMIIRIRYRLSATEYYTGPHISRVFALLKNARYVLVNVPWMVTELAFVAYGIVRIAKNKAAYPKIGDLMKANVPSLVLFALSAVTVIARYLLFANHVYIHAWATYRIADAAILTFNIVLMNLSSGDCAKHEKVSVAHEI